MNNIRIIFICILTFACLAAACVLSGCGSATAAKEGDMVSVDYNLFLADGSLYQTTVDSNPIELIIGNGKYLDAFEAAIVGMKVEQSKTVEIAAADAYPYREDLVHTIARSQLQDGLNPKVGDRLQSVNSNGQPFFVIVVAVSDTGLTIDANSALAGKDLTFEITLLKIN